MALFLGAAGLTYTLQGGSRVPHGRPAFIQRGHRLQGRPVWPSVAEAQDNSSHAGRGFGPPSTDERAGSAPIKCSAAQKRVRKPRKGQKGPAATRVVVNKPAQKAQSPGVATNAESNGSGRNGSEGSARGRSRSPGPGVQVAEVARAAAQRQLSVKLMELEAAATRADQMGDTEEVLRLRESLERESAELAAEAAKAETAERAARKASLMDSERRELERLKAENEALQALVLEVAPDKTEAQDKVAQLKERCKHLLADVSLDDEVPGARSTDADKLLQLPPGLDGGAEVNETQVNLLIQLAAARASLQAETERKEAEAASEAAARHEAEAALEAAARKVAEPIPEAVPEPNLESALPEGLLQEDGDGAGVSTEVEEDVVRLAEAASAEGSNVFVTPSGGVPVGGVGTLYYDVAAGPLGPNARPRLKAGLNKWEEVVLLECAPAEDVLRSLPGRNWWAVDVAIPQDTFQVDFVIEDAASPAVDNNGGRDFRLPLLDALTEEEVILDRARRLEEFEQQRRQLLDTAEAAQWEAEMVAAEEEAAQARVLYRQRREEELATQAEAEAAARVAPPADGITCEEGRAGVFVWANDGPLAGEVATLLYNAASGPLRGATEIRLHVGRDGWRAGTITQLAMQRLSAEEVESIGLPGGEWHIVDHAPEASTGVIDFVLSDNQQRWDNNGKRDYHTRVKINVDPQQLAQELYQMMAAEAEDDIQQGEVRTYHNVIEKAQLRARALRKRRERQRSVVYTLPVNPVAGQEVEVFYNSEATVMRGRPSAWLRGSWNRWTHPQCFVPQRLTPVVKGAPGFATATIEAPEDAWMMDMVFSDTGDMHGGFYDNNGGLDYHIPVMGSTLPVKPLHIVHIAVEMAPIAKVGGMGDVVTALARAVQEEGHHIDVILPKFDVINYEEVKELREMKSYHASGVQVKVWEGYVEELRTIFLEPTNGHVWAGCIYGRKDDPQRFGFFCHAALEYLKHHAGGQRPDIVHCHDWPTAPVAFGDIGQAKAIFTIHNLNYGQDLIGRAMGACRVATTVSPTYATEISGHQAVAPSIGKFYGIRNGIDMDIWDPNTDRFLPRNYGLEDAAVGKAGCKESLRRQFGLSSADVPLVAVVTRLTPQKGIHLIKHAAWRTLERGAQFILLGSAPDPRVQGEFNGLKVELARAYPDRACLYFEFNEPLSHVVYAAADILVVPSMFEPCGLTQMIGMRYGAVPVVRRTGGLNDTVFDVDHDEDRALAAGYETNGFNFEGTDQAALDYALNRALSAWYTDKAAWQELMLRGMQQDWSWCSPALDYIELYYKAIRS